MTIGKIINKPWKLIVLIVLEVVIFIIALWLSAYIMHANEAISSAIVILSILAVGITVILYGNVTRNRIFNTLGFALFLFVVFIIIDRYEGFAVKISAFAVLLLAFAAFMSIEESRRLREENRRIREEQNQEERHRLALERIRNWAEELFGLVTRPTRYRLLQARKQELEGLLHLGGAKSVGVLKDAEIVGGNVHSSVNIANLIIFKFVSRLRGEQDITEFKVRFGIAGIVEPIKDAAELEEQKKELLTALSEIINSATEEMVARR